MTEHFTRKHLANSGLSLRDREMDLQSNYTGVEIPWLVLNVEGELVAFLKAIILHSISYLKWI